MIKIDRFHGDPEELAGFVTGVWKSTYAGHMTYPFWSGEYFRWHGMFDSEERRSYVIAAYDGSRLVGSLMGVPYQLQTPETVLRGSIWSWLSIHPDYQGQRIAVQLDQERVRRLQELESQVVLSYRFVGSHFSKAERPKSRPQPNKQFLRKIGFWIRILNPSQMQKWDLRRMEGCLAWLSAPVAGIPGPGSSRSSIRPLREEDLDACLAIILRQTVGMSLAVHWQPETLKRHLLGSSLSHTLVYETGGVVKGFVNYHLLPMQARIQQPVGVMDLMAVNELPHLSRVHLVNAAMAEMKAQGAILALKVNSSDVPSSTMLHTRWVPKPADSHLVLQWIGHQVPVKSELPMHLLWR